MPIAPTQPVYSPTPGAPVEAVWGQAAAEHVVQRFLTVTDRDTKWTTPPTGAVCVTTTTMVAWIYNGTTWQPFGESAIGSMVMWAGPTVPSRYLLCDGRAVSRTSYTVLYAVLGTLWGAGDGTTTFNLPDMRSRAPIGVGQGTGLTNRALGDKVGTETVSLGAGEIPSHAHSMSHGHADSTSDNENADHQHYVAGTTNGMNGDTSHFHTSYDSDRPYFINQGLGPGGSGIASTNLGVVGPGNTDRTNYANIDHSHNFFAWSGGINQNHQHVTHTPAFNGNTGNTGSGNAHSNMGPAIAVNFIIYAGV